MDEEPETKVKNDTEDSSTEKQISPITITSDGNEGAETVSSAYEGKATEEPHVGAADPEEEGTGGNNITTTEGSVSDINSIDANEPYILHPESPERKATSPLSDETDEDADVVNKQHTRLLHELHEERDKALDHSALLQAKLADYLRKKAGEDPQLGRRIQVPERHEEYEKYINLLADLKQQLAADSETAEQQAEELRLQSQQKLDEVENEWQAFMALKQDVGVTVLRRLLGKQAAQAKVDLVLAAEQVQQDQLIELRVKHIKLKLKIHRLEAEIQDEDERGRDPLQLQFEQLQAEKLEQKKHMERQREESLKLQKKIGGNLEFLSNVKEKLYWSQMQVQAKRQQLAEVEATVAKKRDLLTRTKQARNSLQRDNQRLKESRGLLGNRVLLRDFENTVDASDKLEEQLENLKSRQAETVLSHGRWKKQEMA